MIIGVFLLFIGHFSFFPACSRFCTKLISHTPFFPLLQSKQMPNSWSKSFKTKLRFSLDAQTSTRLSHFAHIPYQIQSFEGQAFFAKYFQLVQSVNELIFLLSKYLASLSKLWLEVVISVLHERSNNARMSSFIRNIRSYFVFDKRNWVVVQTLTRK